MSTQRNSQAGTSPHTTAPAPSSNAGARTARAGRVAREPLAVSEVSYRAMSEASPLGMLTTDERGLIEYANPAFASIVGASAVHVHGRHWSDAVHPEDRQHALERWAAAQGGGTSMWAELRLLRPDRRVVWVRVNAAEMRAGAGSRGHVLSVEDITERKAQECKLRAATEALAAEKERAQMTLDSIGDAIICSDLQGRVTYMNGVAETCTGWARADALGLPVVEVMKIVDATTHESVTSPSQQAISTDNFIKLGMNAMLVRRDGTMLPIEDSAAPIHDRQGQVVGGVIVFHDASLKREAIRRITEIAQHEVLTGLPNRALLAERTMQATMLARRHGKQFALLYVDLDQFKHVNDTLGHAIGDQLLQSVARRLQACVRATDTVSRQGGDEFVILLAEIEHPADAAQVAEKLLAVFAEPQLIDGNELLVTLSIGISVFPDDDDDIDCLLQNADRAMYQAKNGGRNNYQFHAAAMSDHQAR